MEEGGNNEITKELGDYFASKGTRTFLFYIMYDTVQFLGVVLYCVLFVMLSSGLQKIVGQGQFATVTNSLC